MRRKEVSDLFPDLLAVLDATNWEQFKPGNFLENRMSWSAFKHMNVFQVLFGEDIWWFAPFAIEKCPVFSCFHRKTGSVALGNIRRHFERDLCFAGSIHVAQRA
jgi:hypothetical protein